MALYLRDIRVLTDNFSSPGHEQKVLDDLYASSQAAAKLTLTQAIYRYLALETAKEIEAALPEAKRELESLALARNEAVAKVRGLEADLATAEAALIEVGPGHRERELSPEKSAVSKLSKDFREAGKRARAAMREYAIADRRVDGMTKMLTALKGVARPDRAIVGALAEALANAGER